MEKEVLENIFNNARNNIISGIMSTGKTTKIGFEFINKIIKQGESLFILDTKEEYIKKFYDLFKKNDYNMIIINTKEPQKSDCWNPLDYSKKMYNCGKIDKSLKYLNIISEEIFKDSENADPFWNNMAKSLFKGLTLMHFKEAGKDEVNLRSIHTLITDAEMDINYLSEYFRTLNKNSMIYLCASSIIFSPLETRGGIISTALSKLNKIVCREDLNCLINYTNYDYQDILNKKTVIFFVTDELDDSSEIASIYIKELFNIMCDNKINHKFNFILDNFDFLDNIINFKNMLSISIQNNIKLNIFTRDKEILEQKYSNYIDKLSNNIITTDDKIKIKIGEKVKEISNNPVNDNYISSIVYPSNTKKEIKIFNFKKFVINNIKVEENEYKDYILEKSNIKEYVKSKGKDDNPQKKAITDKKANFYIVKKENEIVDSFVIYNEDNWLTIANKSLMDINYVNFIFDNLKDYDYITLLIPSTSDYIVNALKFNFDIISIEDKNQNEYNYIKIKIKI